MQIIRNLKFGTKNALFEYFGEQLWKSIVFFVISTLIGKVSAETKILQIWTKNAKFTCICTGIYKCFCHI